jgi:transcription initiation factor IIE alpha subunit
MKTAKTKKSPCEKYELAITNYVIGEKIDVPQDELFKHLAKCLNCQNDLRNWRATYATMRAQEYDSRPDVKQKSQEFIKELVNRPTPCVFADDEKVLNLEIDTGKLSGYVWDYLAEHGKTSDTELSKQLERDILAIREAIGWLSKEKKIIKSERKDVTFVCLTDEEQEKYRRMQEKAEGKTAQPEA